MRPTPVAVRVETYDADIADGVTASSTTDTAITPSPKVEKLSMDKASFYGANLTAAIQGRTLLRTYQIGPITPSFGAGGSSLADLLGTASKRRRTLIVLGPDDDEFAGGAEVFVVVDYVSKPLRFMLTVQEAAQSVSG